jgi:hypothetical protein
MRRATFTNHALLALLTALVVGSALGSSPEQTKVRITTWNLEWFPNGSAHDATPEVQAQRIAAAADVLRPINPDVILLQEVRDYDACARLGEAVAPGIHPAKVAPRCRAARDGHQSKRILNIFCSTPVGELAILCVAPSPLGDSSKATSTVFSRGKPRTTGFARTT